MRRFFYLTESSALFKVHMAIYAIGDVQGCYDHLQKLLDIIQFDSNKDKLWFAGDLVNRGPQSLQTLRFVKSLGKSAITVLGNHDLTLLAMAEGYGRSKNHTLDDILTAPDRDELLDWLRCRPLCHHNAKRGYTMVHAGIPKQWDIATALARGKEVEKVLQSDKYHHFLANMFGNTPTLWHNDLTGWDRLRYITNAFTRMRYCTHNGALEFHSKGAPGTQEDGYMPWFELENRQAEKDKIIFGHWSTLAGLTSREQVYALDTGCLWGGKLTAMKLGKKKQREQLIKHKLFQLHCE